MNSAMILAPRNAGCACCSGLAAAESRPGRAVKMRRNVKRIERRNWRREAADDLDD